MNTLTDGLNFLDSLLGSAVYFPLLLLGVGVFFSFYLGFPQLRYFRHAFQVLRGKHTSATAVGDTNHFQALSTALSGTVGTGNLGGVAFAIFLGGPAALFWMWATAFVGMTTKFVEVTLSHKYRVTDEKGEIAGGPMYFMERRLNMKWLAVIFAIATVISSFGTGSLPQSNNMAAGLEASFGVPVWVSGGVLALLLGAVILGGIHRIAYVAARIVPTMGVLYAFAALAVLLSNIDGVIPAFVSVFEGAFTGSAAAGGFLGASFAYAFNRGVNRGLFSNEAGQGSAPIAHASAKTDEPVAEGMVSILEPFIDTLIICTLTGVVILSSGVWNQKFDNRFAAFDTIVVAGEYSEASASDVSALAAHLDLTAPEDDSVVRYNGEIAVNNGAPDLAGITVLHNRSIAEDVSVSTGDQPFSGVLIVADGRIATDGVDLDGRSLLHSVPLTREAFKRSFLGEFGGSAVTVALVLFAFSTALAWSYYGDRAMTYLFGAASVLPYRVLYVIGFFLATIVDTSLIWLIAAITIALMTLPNLFGICLLAREMKQEVAGYWQRRQKAD